MAYSRIRDTDLWPARYALGMWVWLLHRISGLVIALYGIAHVTAVSFSRLDGGNGFNTLMEMFHNPYIRIAELALVAAIIYHCANGLRVILFDLGVGVRHQKGLFWSLIAVGVVVWLIMAWVLVPSALSPIK